MPQVVRADVADVASAVSWVGGLQGQRLARYIVWLGAGASQTAGIPTASGVVERLLDRYFRMSAPERELDGLEGLSVEAADIRKRDCWDWAIAHGFWGITSVPPDSGLLYTTALQSLPGELDRQEFILNCVEEGRGRLNEAHLLLAQLMVNEFVRIVLTTNFDDLLVRALQLFFRFPAVIDPTSTQTLMSYSPFLQIAYLHGKLSSYRQRHTSAQLSDGIPGLEPFLVQILQDHGLIVVGYRGGDETPMLVLEKVLRERGTGPGRGLFWVTKTDDVEMLSPRVRVLLSLRDVYWIAGIDADSFFERLCAAPGIGLGMPERSMLVRRLEEVLPVSVQPVRIPDVEPPHSRPEAKIASPGIDAISDDEYRPIRQALRSRQYGEALALLGSEPIESYVDSERARLRGMALLGLWQRDEASRCFRRAIELDPGNARAFDAWGDALAGEGDYMAALSKYRSAVDVQADFVVGWRDVAHALRKLGRLDEAVSILETALSKWPADSWLLAEMTDVLDERGEHELALEYSKRLIEYAPSFEFGYESAARALRALGKSEESLPYSAKAAELAPHRPWLLASWADALMSLGRAEAAIEKLKRAAELAPAEGTYWIDWGRALASLARHEEAIELYRKAEAVDPRMSDWAGVFAAASLATLGRAEEALERIGQVTRDHPAFVWGWTNQGKLLAELGRTKDALDSYQEALRIQPQLRDAQEAVRKLGWVPRKTMNSQGKARETS